MANPVKVGTWIYNAMFEWLPNGVNDLYAGDWGKLVTDVFIPILLQHIGDIVSDVINDPDIPILEKFASVAFAISAVEANILFAAVFLAAGLALSYASPPEAGSFCSNFWEYPPGLQPPATNGSPGNNGWYLGYVYHVFNYRYDWRHDMGDPQKGLPTAI
ncbi:hypothetical protein E6H17_06335 [Candidatus Bathyarchaeota archaeon]|nr:MAG: hypothetical protein E6H17_06335 [Candidatus Bathyarchaeota archaeon]TMI76486.1 MAG: hypothetical protein E6H11_00520 [Candidatus Bathyarchaeota archaeon]